MNISIHPDRTALVLIDMQNDFLHADGAYARGKQTADSMRPLPQKLLGIANALRRTGGWIVSTHFTIITGKGGQPFISPHLKALRPFLRKGDFESGGWGHDVLDVLRPVDIKVEKVAYSAFYQSRLEFALKKAGIETLIVGGIVTNGGVASTVRDAHVRGFKTIVLTDGTAAFSTEHHEAAIASLSTVSAVASCDKVISLIEEKSPNSRQVVASK